MPTYLVTRNSSLFMLAFTNGNILSMEEPIEAVLITKDRIGKTGSKGILKNIPPTNIIDLKGRILIPGFIDSHTHFVDTGLNLKRVDLSQTKSLKDALELAGDRIRKENKKTPLICVDFDESRWDEKRIPGKEELDRLSKKRPIIFRRICGHLAVANSRAIELIPECWKKIDKKIGILLEDVVLYINRVFPPSDEEIKTAIIQAQKKAHSLGITSIHDMTTKRYLNIYKKTEAEGNLRLRVYAILPISELGSITNTQEQWLKTGGVKLFADGSIGARTAALKSPYPGTDNYGILNYKTSELERIVKEAEKKGIQVFIHAIGERAIEQVLNVYELSHIPVEGKTILNSSRHRIEHFELADDDLIKRAKELNIILAMQPNFITNWGMEDGMYQDILGERGLYTNRFKTISDKGCMVCFGSDSMPMDPLYGIKGAMEHPKESISFEQAVRMSTINSAYAGFDEKDTGSIKKGKKADLVILSGSPPHLKVDMTIVNGEIVYNVGGTSQSQ